MLKKLKMTDWFFLGLVFILSLSFYKVIHFFIADIFLSLILARLLWGFTENVHKRFRLKRSFAVFISVFLTIIFILSPIAFVGFSLSGDLIDIYQTISNKLPLMQDLISNNVNQIVFEKFPFLSKQLALLKQQEFQQQLYQAFAVVAKLSYKIMERTFVNASLVIFHLLIIIIMLYFLLLEGRVFLKKIFDIFPLEESEKWELLNETLKITDATLLGTLFVGLIEGVYGGILFYLFNIPNPTLWGIIIAIFSVLPMIGMNSAIFPMGLILIFSGRLVPGILLILLGYAGTTFTQGYLKPYFVSWKGGLHPVIVLISTIGGIIWMGLPGFIIGPVISALFFAIWNQFYRHFKYLDKNE